MSNEASGFLRVLRVTFLAGSAVFVVLALLVGNWSFAYSGAVAFIVGLMIWKKIDSPKSGSSAEIHVPPSPSEVIALAVGYLIMIVAALFLSTVPLIMFPLLLVGSSITKAVSRPRSMKERAVTTRGLIILTAGCAVILAVVFAYNDKQLPHWASHPETLILAWLFLFMGVRHLRHVASQLPRRPTVALVS